MGNCASNPKTKESDDAPMPEPVEEEVKVDETATTEKSLGTLLNESEVKEAEEAKEESEEVSATAVEVEATKLAEPEAAEEAKPVAAQA